MKYPVFICDDDQMQVNDIVKMIGKAEEILSDEHAIEFDVASVTTFSEAKTYLKKNVYTGGIYLLDIGLGQEVGQNNGFDLAELIKSQDKRAQIIFITTHADLSLISFERRLGPVDYIVKPRNKEDDDRFKQRLVATLEISISNIENFDYTEKLTFHYKVGRQVRNIDIDDIIYISTTKTPHKLIMVNVRGENQFFGSINQYAKESAALVKISQSCLANPKNIKLIDLPKYKVTFVNGDTVDFSQSAYKRMQHLYDKIQS